MDYEKFWDDLLTEAKLDMEYQQGLQTLAEKEKAYLAVCEPLSPAQRKAVEDYISACEAQADYMVFLAYRLGKRER